MDDIGKIFRSFFHFPSRSGTEDWRHGEFRDETDGDDDFFKDHRRSQDGDRGFDIFFGGRGGHGDLNGMFEHFHSDIQRNMASLHSQMEDMMRSFGAVEFPPSFDPPKTRDPELPGGSFPNSPPQDDHIQIWFGTPSPFFRPGGYTSKRSPRDFMLKEEEPDNGVEVTPAFPVPHNSSIEDPKRNFSMVPRRDKSRPLLEKDTDLDGKLNPDEILALIKKQPENQELQSLTPPAQPRCSTWGKSVHITRIMRPDGKVEQKRVVRDSNGHEESTVTKSVGDQAYTVTSITGDNGCTETRESFQNMEENDVGKFKDRWQHPDAFRPRVPADSPRLPVEIDIRDGDMFSRLFEWRNK